MERRHATHPDQLPGMTTERLRAAFLVPGLFQPGEVVTVFTDHDRIVLGGAMPAGTPLVLPAFDELGAEYFLERRELGIVNVGGPGRVVADGEAYHLREGACLYLGRGVRDVVFDDETGAGAQFFLFSAPAHTAYPSTLVEPDGGTVRELGDPLTSNRRTLTQFIHEDGIRSCQIVMGTTRLHPGSMWNTMPPHVHGRRTECYLYFDLPDDARVIHLLGEPDETRHLVVADRQAIISPPWSLHSGVGTQPYAFVWAMAGENQAFDDMDPVAVGSLR